MHYILVIIKLTVFGKTVNLAYCLIAAISHCMEIHTSNILYLVSGAAMGEGGGWGLEPPFVENATSYLVAFIRIQQNLYFIYPI